MRWSIHNLLRLWAIAALAASSLAAAESHGQVTFGGLPLPGATVTATQETRQFTTITDPRGLYSFADLPNGLWTIEVRMTGFATLQRDVTVAPDAPAATWEMKLLPLDQIEAAVEAPAAPPPAPAPPAVEKEPPKPKPEPSPQTAPPENDLSQGASDSLLINGSVNNGAASPFAQTAAFGNNRSGGKGLYTGGIGLIFDNSALDAIPFSLTGQNTPKPSYNDLTGVATLGGPLKIPHLLEDGPNFFVAYQWTRNRNATTQWGLVPSLAERAGTLAGPVRDPLTGAPFPGNAIPPGRISPQAQALLNLYPMPNFNGNSRYNYELPIVSPTHQDGLQSRLGKRLNNKNSVYGGVAFQSTRTDTPSLFGFLDTSDLLGLNASANWWHGITQRLFFNLGAQYSRMTTHVTPYFENRRNVSGDAGIAGNNQEPVNWGPPSLVFANGVAGLSDALPSFNRFQTSGLSFSMLWNRGVHYVTYGGDFRRQEFNYLSQQDPRGTFTLTGAATGDAFGDFLLGVPDTSSIAFGNADKYFRESAYDAYFTDDWRVRPELTINAGLRWEYAAPITELYDRLVNLDIAPGFGAAAPVLASDPSGPLTGQRYPSSLLRPDKHAFEPRIGVAWRPLSGSSLVVRAGYGMYYNTSVYQSVAPQLAQQPPLSKTLSVQNSPANPLTLANGFNAAPATTPNTFAIDPNFRVGYAQEWQLTVQRDLPASLQMTATYLGIKGARGLQEFLPNTVPTGAANPCPACPAGFVYLASNGNSTREAGQIQLRRRLHSGFTALLQYTFSKSIDDDATLGGQGAIMPTRNFSAAASGPGGPPQTGAATGSSAASPLIAQNWLDLSAERSLSSFDQRHLLTLQAQYTTGMGLKGGTLVSGWKGALFKEWVVSTSVTVGSGLPQTPIYLVPVPGTGVTGTIRPDYTGAPLYSAPAGLFLNPVAYVAPAPGQWGNAGRNTITGPSQFVLNASLGRTFRLNDRFHLDLRVDSTNALNHVTFTSWNTIINNAQFGSPAAANAMRSMQTVLRLRF